MKYLKQFCIILFLSFLGEALRSVIPLPIPASVYGLVLMLGALASGILKVSQVRETSEFLIEIMPVMFIPAGVGLMDYRTYHGDRNGDNRCSDPADDQEGEEKT